MNELASVLDIEPQRPSRADYSVRSYGGRGDYSGSYTGYGARRSFSRARSSDEEEYGYRSDLPPESSGKPAGGFSAASAFKRAQAANKPAAPGGKDYAAFRAGVKVRHPKFGDGLIVSTRGEGSALIANVSFPGLGIKSLSVQIAPLTVIS